MPDQDERQKSVRLKHNVIELEFKGKNVLLVEDSIVRGTTTEHIVQMARSAGANKVYLASAAPPVRYPNVYGIDMPAAHEFIAYGKTEEEDREGDRDEQQTRFFERGGGGRNRLDSDRTAANLHPGSGGASRQHRFGPSSHQPNGGHGI